MTVFLLTMICLHTSAHGASPDSEFLRHEKQFVPEENTISDGITWEGFLVMSLGTFFQLRVDVARFVFILRFLKKSIWTELFVILIGFLLTELHPMAGLAFELIRYSYKIKEMADR